MKPCNRHNIENCQCEKVYMNYTMSPYRPSNYDIPLHLRYPPPVPSLERLNDLEVMENHIKELETQVIALSKALAKLLGEIKYD